MVSSEPRVDTDYARCAACGVLDDAEWGMTLRCDRLRHHAAFFRLCDDCKTELMLFLQTTPDRGPSPLRGYS
jgi:hypothetical protein